MILEILFASHLAMAAEESVGASSEASAPTTGELLGQSTIVTGAESTDVGVKATIAAIGPELSSTLAVGTTAVVATAITYAKWQEAETSQRYRDAAAEGAQRLARGEATPITNAAEDSSLRLVAGLERAMNPVAVQAASEDKIVRLIVLRAQKFE